MPVGEGGNLVITLICIFSFISLIGYILIVLWLIFNHRGRLSASYSMAIGLKSSIYAYHSAKDLWFHAFFSAVYEEWIRLRMQGFLFLPIFLSFGIGTYFSLPVEPPLPLGVFACVLSACLYVFLGARFRVFAFFVLFCSLGFLAGQVRSAMVYTPILSKDMGPLMVEGYVLSVEDMGEDAGLRLVLDRLDIEDLEKMRTPVRVRLKVRQGDNIAVGQRVRVLAELLPPSAPVLPGGFDFQRYLFFQRIGAVGFTYKPPEIVLEARRSGFVDAIERARQWIAQRVEARLDYPEAGVVMALMIGRRGAIAENVQENMRASGLAHMLAISGLHVGLFSGALFFFVRVAMAMIPALALQYPIKKIAASIALFGAFGYMFLAGASIPTQRAVLMTGVVLLAIMLDRMPISMRLVAFSALIVLFLFPESLLSASFHMSFAAVSCLVAFYDWLKPYWSIWHRKAGFFRRLSLYFLGVCFTSIVAGLATAPFALFHFHQVALYGVLANLVSVPILAFVIMPSILLSFVLMPFGLDQLGLMIAGYGVEAVLDVAQWVSDMPHAIFRVPLWPLNALVMLVFSGLGFVLLRGYFRAVALVPLFLSILLLSNKYQYDVLVSSSNKLISVRAENGDVWVNNLRKDRFTREIWAESYGLSPEELKKWPKEGMEGPVICGEGACRLKLKGKTVSFLRAEYLGQAECEHVDLVIAPFPLSKLCSSKARAHTIDLYDSHDHGAHGVFIDGDIIKIEHVQRYRGQRFWVNQNLKNNL